MKLAFDRAPALMASTTEHRRPSSSFVVHPRVPVLAPAAVVALLAVAGAAARRPLSGGGVAPAIPAWPLLIVVGVGVVATGAIVATALRPPPRRRRGLEREPILPVRAGPLTIALTLLVPLAIVALLAGPAGTSAIATPGTIASRHHRRSGLALRRRARRRVGAARTGPPRWPLE